MNFLLRTIARGTISLLALLCFQAAFAQTQTIKGSLFETSSLSPVIGAVIEVEGNGLNYSALSDNNGQFKISDLPLGRYDVTVKAMGYNTYVQPAVNLLSAKQTVLEIGMMETSEMLQEVVVNSNQRRVTNEAAVVSAKSFNLEELSRIPGSVDDPARMIRKFAGVPPTANIANNSINVRGNAARGLRYRLEDMDIYNPNHFGLLGGSGGSLTIFSQHLLTSTDFYSGAFPADYGNTTGAVFDMRFRNGNTERHEQAIQMSFLGIDFAAEGPLSGNGRSSYIANYRYSSTGIINSFLNFGTIPTFQDLSFKLNWKLKKGGQLNVFGLAGASSSSFTPTNDTTQWNGQSSAFGSMTSSTTATAGISYLKPLSDRTYFKSILVGTGIEAKQSRYYLRSDYITRDTSRIGDDFDFTTSWQGYINHKFNDRHTHRSGVIVSRLYSDVEFVQGIASTTDIGAYDLSDTLRYGQGSSFLTQAYSRSQYQLTENLKLNAGVHVMALAMTGEISVEPRLGLRYLINSKSNLNFAYGLHSQMEPFFTYISESYDPTTRGYRRKNGDLGFNKAHHFTVSYNNQLSQHWKFGAELYYQDQYNLVVGATLPVSRVAAPDFRFESHDLNNGGVGTNYGLEMSIERGFSDGYFFMANTSLYESNYTANDGIKRNSMFNAGYIVNVVSGKEWQLGGKRGKSNVLNINVSASVCGPQYFTNADLVESANRGYYVADFANPNTGVQDALTLIDASIIYKKNKAKSSTIWTLQLSNLLNQRAITGNFYDRDNQSLQFVYGTGMLPIISWRKNF